MIVQRFRLVCLLLFLILCISLLIARFYSIQVEESEKWQKIARRQHYFIVQEPAPRGSFFSNESVRRNHPEKSQKLVVEIEKFHLHIDPQSFPPQFKKEAIDKLWKILESTGAEKETFARHFYKKSRNRKAASWLDKEKQEEIAEWWRPFAKQNKIPQNALFFVTDYQRSYPFGSLLGQLLHTTRSQKEEISDRSVPTGGLELYFDHYLQGRPGKRRLMRSPRNAYETGEVIDPPVKGADIYLTVNHYLQAIVEEELEKGAKKFNAKGARAVMMNPKTGEILAIAHYPFFNPSEYQKFFNDPESARHVEFGVATDAIEFGSVLKPFTVCAAILANEEVQARGEPPLFDFEEKTATSNGKFPGRSRPLVDTRLHHFMNLRMAVQKSGNIYLARLVEKIISKLGPAWYRDFLHDRLGFGKKTGIEFPVESPGMLPALGKRYASGALEWSISTPFSLSMGYNLQLNALQLVRAYAILANGGYLVNPTFIRRIVGTSPKGEEIVYLDNTLPERCKSFPRVLSKKVVDEVVKTIKFTTKPGGSAPKAEVYGYTEAGKTGTAKMVVNGVYTDRYRASFIGFAPVTDPAFVLYVMLDQPTFGYTRGIGKTNHGGTAAAPVFSKIVSRALPYLGVALDDPSGYPKGDPRSDLTKADWITEAKNLQQTYDSWNK